jgi:hypothetical protein
VTAIIVGSRVYLLRGQNGWGTHDITAVVPKLRKANGPFANCTRYRGAV